MTSQQYLLSLLNINELFKIRDACEILKQFGLQDDFLVQNVYAEIQKRVDNANNR